MDNLKKLLKDVLEYEEITELHFKHLTFNDKEIYFILLEESSFIQGRISNASLNPVGFIIHIGDEYYYVSLDGDDLSKEVLEGFFNFICPEEEYFQD